MRQIAQGINAGPINLLEVKITDDDVSSGTL
jgi:hypothetical protein